jgi:hypothetical protein
VKFERGLNWHRVLSYFTRNEVSITNVAALTFASHFW